MTSTYLFIVMGKLAPIMGEDMEQGPAPRQERDDVACAAEAEIPFATLLYRFLFFDWLFADMTMPMTLFERHAAWQHNRKMRMYLPLYLRRWSVLCAADLGTGCIFEKFLASKLLAAWFFSWSCVIVSGMVVITVLWVFLSNSDVP